ncbi:hypothetical protein LTR78_009458 [Recurvomyces mirabilis]|uniref:Uncharacterized protein n=1 Tax=Recurvomyces mirabilis TaxID=574656 RepID=A0AAE0TS99_9PEZI|nr:hypothetical protein LTR78_009458 [Recurvomyces mirabilis]KAK5152363.1 hypothetical protein LTS14_008310 [Recurvomyces mirabilis]
MSKTFINNGGQADQRPLFGLQEAEGQGCTACAKAGWHCPGYDDRFISVDNKSQARTKARTGALEAVPVLEFLPQDIPGPLTSKTELLRLEFVWKMEVDVLAVRLAMMPATHILKHIPERIGYSRALDDAVACATQSFDGPPGQERVLYIKALRSLRETLDDEKQVQAPETLAAASILQMYEQHTDHPGQQWIYHARGVVRMLKARGVDGMNTALEMSILEAQSGNTFLHALTRNQDCFLAHPAWARALKPSAHPQGHLDRYMRMLVDGAVFPDMSALTSEMVLTCRYDKRTSYKTRQSIATLAIADIMRARKQLLSQLETGPGFSSELGMADALTTAAYAATGFFLIILDTMVIGMQQQAEALGVQISAFQQDLVPQEVLGAERQGTLDAVVARFKLLQTLSPHLSTTAPRALRVIVGTILGIGEYNDGLNYEALLDVLGHELEDERW